MDYLYDHFSKLLFVAENGISSYDILIDDGHGSDTVYDDYFSDVYHQHILAMVKVIDESVHVFGYTSRV